MKTINRNSFYVIVILLFLCSACVKTSVVQEVDRGTKSTMDILNNNFSFSLFRNAVNMAGLTDKVNGDTLTILVPDNTAFERIGITTVDDLARINKDSLRKWIGHHMAKGKIKYDDVPQTVDNEYWTIDNNILYFSKRQVLEPWEVGNKYLHVNGDTLDYFDLEATNGVIHVLHTPLKYPAASVKEIIDKDTTLTLYVAALKKFRLYDQLVNEGPFTLFAPVNKAFLNLGIDEDSINRMNPASFKNLLFGSTVLTPNRIFTTDILNAKSNQNGPNGVGNYLFTLDGIVEFEMQTGINPVAFVYGYVYCADYPDCYDRVGGGYGNPAAVISRDHIAKNGVVHKLSNLIFYPADMQK